MPTIDNNLARALATQRGKVLNAGTSDGAKKGWDSRHTGGTDEDVARHIHTALGMNHDEAQKTRMSGGHYFSTEKPNATPADYMSKLQAAGWHEKSSLRGIGGKFHDIVHDSGAKATIMAGSDKFDIQRSEPAAKDVADAAIEASARGNHSKAYDLHKQAAYAYEDAGNEERGDFHRKMAKIHLKQ